MVKQNDWVKIEPVTQGDSTMFEFEKENDTLMGIYKGKKEGVGQNKSTIYYVEVKDEGLKAFWGSTLLDSRLQNIEVGDEIKLVYLGKQKSEKSGREYKNFDVYHRKP